jgi:hypothetical protein
MIVGLKTTLPPLDSPAALLDKPAVAPGTKPVFYRVLESARIAYEDGPFAGTAR